MATKKELRAFKKGREEFPKRTLILSRGNR